MDGLFIMEKPKNKMDDLGGNPPIFGNIQINQSLSERNTRIPINKTSMMKCRKGFLITAHLVWSSSIIYTPKV